MKKVSAFFKIVLLIAVLIQVTVLSIEYGANLIAVRKNLGKSGQWRGANFNQSQRVADYIEFLNRNIPDNARVVLPSFLGDSKILITPYMQFFLAPRQVINCTSLECMQSVSRDESYIIITGNLPVDLYPNASYTMFDDNWGLILPTNNPSGRFSEIITFNSVGEFIRSGIPSFVWVAMLTLSGTLLVLSILPRQKYILSAALGYGLGLGLFSIGVVVLSIVKHQFDSESIIITTAVLFGVAICVFFVGRVLSKNGDSQIIATPANDKFDFWPGLLVILGVIAFGLAVGKGYHRIDAIQIWGAKGYGIASVGSLDLVTEWGTNTLAYPLHVIALIASFRTLFGDLLPSSKLIFSGYYLALMIICYDALLNVSVKRWLSGLGILLVVTAPVVFQHGTIGYANLPLTYYLLSGILLLLPVFVTRSSQMNMLLSGVFLACAAWTRPEGLMLSLSGIVLYVLLGITYRKDLISWQKILGVLAPLFFYLIIWQIIQIKIYPEPLAKSNLTQQALEQNFVGEFHIKEILFITLGVFSIIAAIFILVYYKNISYISKAMIFFGVLFMLLIIGMYYLTSYDTVNDLGWWVSSGLNRMIFPGIFIFGLGIIVGINDILKAMKPAK